MPPVCFNPYQATLHDRHGTGTDLPIALLFLVKHLVLLIYHFLRILPRFYRTICCILFFNIITLSTTTHI